MSIMEAAGLTRDEARVFVSNWRNSLAARAAHKIADALEGELDALPLEPGDRVTFPFGKGEVFEVLLVHGDWVVGVGEDGIPTTLSLGAVERQA